MRSAARSPPTRSWMERRSRSGSSSQVDDGETLLRALLAHKSRMREIRTSGSMKSANTGHSQTAWRTCQIDPKRKVVAVDSRSPNRKGENERGIRPVQLGGGCSFWQRLLSTDIVEKLEFRRRSQLRRPLAASMEISLGAQRSDRFFCVRPSLSPCCGKHPWRQRFPRGSGIFAAPQFPTFSTISTGCGQSLGSPPVKTPPRRFLCPKPVPRPVSPPRPSGRTRRKIVLLRAAAATSDRSIVHHATGTEQIAAERRDGHRLDQKPRGFIPIDDDWRERLSAAAFRMQNKRNQLLESAIAGGIAGRRTTLDEVEVVAQ